MFMTLFIQHFSWSRNFSQSASKPVKSPCTRSLFFHWSSQILHTFNISWKYFFIHLVCRLNCFMPTHLAQNFFIETVLSHKIFPQSVVPYLLQSRKSLRPHPLIFPIPQSIIPNYQPNDYLIFPVSIRSSIDTLCQNHYKVCVLKTSHSDVTLVISTLGQHPHAGATVEYSPRGQHSFQIYFQMGPFQSFSSFESEFRYFDEWSALSRPAL